MSASSGLALPMNVFQVSGHPKTLEAEYRRFVTFVRERIKPLMSVSNLPKWG
jgi:hypothetical protein